MFTSALSTLGFRQNNKMMSHFLDKELKMLSRGFEFCNHQEQYVRGPTKH